MSDAPLLDLDHLARYTGGDAPLEAELFALFTTQAETCVARLEAASDMQEWTAAAHTLKGASRGVGAMRLGDVCATAEDSPLDAHMIAKVRASATATLQEMRRVLESRS